MPGVCRYGINKLKEHLAAIVGNGLTSVLLFGVTEKLEKVIIILTLIFDFYDVFAHFFRTVRVQVQIAVKIL